ncbi:S-layer homology domain-containing protein [Paenibacillus sambharensis]|uniref:S-layer homology domain-containing protein n=1 Tax=Paenibacillus sambharensis TaxID=1803190 RepID=A0A2W1L3C8_9BACL|nr:S-layer homology domain-containing protein [Paenibacillus sambharensis]PZD93856.1 S-layer homology domain-containing protein [Paenibacillus sambharensis]
MKKPVLIVLLAAALILIVGQTAWAFSDTKQDPNADKIKALKEAGIISGEQQDLFNPTGKLTYSAGISMIVRGFELSLAHVQFIKAPEASDYYTNVKNDMWYSNAFVIAHHNGIEIPKDVKPEQIMTREEYAHYLFNAITSRGDFAFIEIYQTFDDESKVNEAYMNSIQKLLTTDIADMKGTNTFRPKDAITRSESAGWLYDGIEFVKKHTDTDSVPDQPAGASPLFDLQLSVKEVNADINEVTVKAQAPHPGYGIRISSIFFDEKGQAVIMVEPVQPDPNKMYPQVITEVQTVTYVSSKFKPVLPEEPAHTNDEAPAAPSLPAPSATSGMSIMN